MNEKNDKKETRWSSVDLLFWVGCLLISAGLALQWGLPVGLIAGGASCLADSYLSDAGKHDGKGGDSP